MEQGKILADFRMEIELGLFVYNTVHPDMCVYFDEREIDEDTFVRNYLFSFIPDGHIKSVSGIELDMLTVAMKRPVDTEIGYCTLDALIADWNIASQPVWTTWKPNKVLA